MRIEIRPAFDEAIIVYALITRYPLLRNSERLSAVTAAYALICLAAAVAESILAQRIEASMQEFYLG